MKWHFASDRPIYTQIVNQIKSGILAGIYRPGSSMPSVRVLALEAEVNPNTMQRALAELEAQGLLNTQRNSGRTVTEDGGLIMELRQKAGQELAEQYLAGMQNLGIPPDEAVQMITEVGASCAPKTAAPTNLATDLATSLANDLATNALVTEENKEANK